MERKKLEKKLSLNKRTITNEEMREAAGGTEADSTFPNVECFSHITITCTCWTEDATDCLSVPRCYPR